MADPSWVFHPFRAIHYRFEQSSDLSDLISPPYDIISEQRQAELYGRSDHNFVRVELTRSDASTRYGEAARTFRGWLADGALVQEKAPAMYVLEQQFTAAGRSWRRRGVFGLVRLPDRDRSYVLCHEGTLAEPKADRLKLMRACGAMTSPVMLITEDESGRLMRLLENAGNPPDAHARESDGVVDRLWLVRGSAAAEAFSAAIGGGPLYIADGHHRFETALTYQDEMRALFPEAPPTAGFNHALVLISSAQEAGLRIFPTHRLISGLDEPSMRALRQSMEQHFEVDERPLSPSGEAVDLTWLDEPGPAAHVLGAYTGNAHLFRLIARPGAEPGGGVVDHLDVSILHRRLIDPGLARVGAAPGQGRISHDSDAAGPATRGPRLTYTTDAAQAVAAVDRGDYDVAFFLRPTRVAEVIAAARAGQCMPGKSTYFYPKIPAGLVISDASEEPI